MALSLMLRNSPKVRGLPSLLSTKWISQPQKGQNFSQVLLKNNANKLSLSSRCRIQFVKMAEQQRNMSADHSKLWPIEKFISLLLLGVVPATFICPNKIFDNLFAVAVVMHFHWGLEACVVDYIRPIIFGNAIPKVALGLLYIISASTLAALIYFNQHQIGIGETVRRFWCITGTPADNENKANQ